MKNRSKQTNAHNKSAGGGKNFARKLYKGMAYRIRVFLRRWKHFCLRVKSKINPIWHFFRFRRARKPLSRRMLALSSIKRAINKIPKNPRIVEFHYLRWAAKAEPKAKTLRKQRAVTFPVCPLISIVVPLYHTPLFYLASMVESARAQTYPHWQLCLYHGGELSPALKRALEYYQRLDARIVVKYGAKNLGIAGNTNAAIKMAKGEFIGFLDHDDTLAPFALYEIVKRLNEHPAVDYFYSDEDYLSDNGKMRFGPQFKSEFSIDWLSANNYINHFSVVRKSIGDAIGWIREGYDGSQDHDFVLRVSEQTTRFERIPKILYHWRLAHGSVAASDAKPYARISGKRTVKEYWARQGYDILISDIARFRGFYRVEFLLKTAPLVSIIIPNKDALEYLEPCIASIRMGTTYTRYEILIVENGSKKKETFAYYKKIQREDPRVRVIVWTPKNGFNYAALNNFAAKRAKGTLLLLLNNDTQVIAPEWLSVMVGYAMRKDIGAVGAKLYFADNTVQHGGVTVGGRIAGHFCSGVEFYGNSHGGRLIIPQNVRAVTGACLMVKKRTFEEVGGLDERFKVAFNDVDFCLKLIEKGYLNVFVPFATLYHFESKSRGYEDTPEKWARFDSERDLLIQKWPEFWNNVDPYGNPNLTPGDLHIKAPSKSK